MRVCIIVCCPANENDIDDGMLTRRAIGIGGQRQIAFAHATWLIRINLVLGVAGLVAFVAGPVALQVVVLTAIMVSAVGMSRLAALSTDDHRERAGWSWFALCFVFYALYFVTCLPNGERFGPEVSFGNATSRILTLIAYICSLTGLALAVRIPRGFLGRLLLDAGIVVVGGAIIMAEILQSTSISISAPALSTRLLYRPLVDLAIISIIAIALASMPRTARLYPSLVRGMGALGCVFIGHLGASVAVLRGYNTAPAWVYVFYTLAGVLFVAAAYRYILGDTVGAGRRPAALIAHNPVTHSFWFHLGNAVVPYTIAMSAATLLFIRALGADDADTGAQLSLLGALAFISVGGLRHVLSHVENRNLYKHMSELNRGLENLVEQRTSELVRRNDELEAVHRVAMVSAESLDLRVILQSVAEQLTQAVGASSCVIYERGDDRIRVVARFERGEPASTSRLRELEASLIQIPHRNFEEAGHRTLVVKRWEQEEGSRVADILDLHGASIAMVVPLLAGDQTAGIAEIYRTLPEPFSDQEVSLAEAVTTHAALASENARAYSRARFAANHDPVTGLLNHRALHEELNRLFVRAMQTASPLTVLMLDLNMFKEFNDRFGHQAGDGVLAEVARSITRSVPASAIAARYGGDEFTIVIPDCPPETTEMFITAIREYVDLIQENHGYVGEGFGIAAGIASYPKDGTNLSRIISLSDERMYADKWRLKGFTERRTENLGPGALPVSGFGTTSGTGV